MKVKKIMAIANLERMLGVNPFGKMIEIENIPETITEVEIKMDKIIRGFIEKYKLFSEESIGERMSYLMDRALVTFTPLQIDFLLQMIIHGRSQDWVNNKITGRFITKLLTQSYNAGNNNFILTINDAPIPELCDYIRGTAERKLNLKIYGDLVKPGGKYSNHCEYLLDGNMDASFGMNSTNCIFKTTNYKNYQNIIRGNIGYENIVHMVDDKGNIMYGDKIKWHHR